MRKDGNEVSLKPVETKAAAPLSPVDTGQLVETWFKEFFPNSPVSRDTEAWNLLLRAKDVLKQRLKGE